MPYKDHRKQKKAMAKLYRDRYDAYLAFREAEKKRKAAWYQLNRERLIAKVIEGRKGKR